MGRRFLTGSMDFRSLIDRLTVPSTVAAGQFTYQVTYQHAYQYTGQRTGQYSSQHTCQYQSH